MGRVDPEDAAKTRLMLVVFEVDQHLLRNRTRVLGAKQGIATALLKPAYDRLIIEPGDDELAVQMLNVFLFLGVSDRRTVGHDRGHGVALQKRSGSRAGPSHSRRESVVGSPRRSRGTCRVARATCRP